MVPDCREAIRLRVWSGSRVLCPLPSPLSAGPEIVSGPPVGLAAIVVGRATGGGSPGLDSRCRQGRPAGVSLGGAEAGLGSSGGFAGGVGRVGSAVKLAFDAAGTVGRTGSGGSWNSGTSWPVPLSSRAGASIASAPAASSWPGPAPPRPESLCSR